MSGYEVAFVLLAWAVAGASPGPATLAIAGTAMSRGRAGGLAVAGGIVCGSAFWGVTAALGMSALMMANVWLVDVVRYAGAAYILYLAFKAAKSAWKDEPLSDVSAKSGGLDQVFLKGLLIHITNPKAIFAWGAIFAVVVPPGSAPVVLAQTFGALIAVSCVVFFGYGLLFSTGSVVRSYRKLRRLFDGAFAILFGAAGIKILTTRITS